MRARFIGALCVATSMFGATACRRQAAPNTASPAAAPLLATLSLIPPDADFVLAADFDRMRAQAGWATVFPALVRTTKPFLDGFEGSTGLDLTRHLRRVAIALPAERQADDRFVIVAEVDRLDEKRLRAAIANRIGTRVTVEIRNHNQIVVRHGAWADAKARTRLDENPEMRRLCERAASGHAAWFAAVVPPSVRRSLMPDARFSDVAAMARASGHLDLQNGVEADVAAELMTATDATNLVHRLSVYLNQMKRQPDMLVHGLAPILDAIRLSVSDATVQAHLDLPMAQLAECVERFESLAQSFRTK